MTLDMLIEFTMDDFHNLLNWYERLFAKKQNMTPSEEKTYYKLIIGADQEVMDKEQEMRTKQD